MKKAITITLYTLGAIGVVLLFVATYFQTSGVNEWWNENVKQWLGGASISLAVATVFQLAINFSSKSNLDLGLKRVNDSSSSFNASVGEIKETLNSLKEENSENITKVQQIIQDEQFELDVAKQNLISSQQLLESKSIEYERVAKRFLETQIRVENLEQTFAKLDQKFNTVLEILATMVNCDEKMVINGKAKEINAKKEEAIN